MAEMATNHVVEEGEADDLLQVAALHQNMFFLLMRCKVVMDSLGQMKKLSKWAIFENQDGLLATSVLHDFCLWNQLQVIHRCYASEAPSSTMGQLGLGCSKLIGVAVSGTSPGGGWLESSQITTCVPFLHIEPWHFQGWKVCESTSRLIEVVPLTRIPSIHPPSTGLPALHLQGESLINPAVVRLKKRWL